jgi:hypothetical protein
MTNIYFIYVLFNDAINSSFYIVSNFRMNFAYKSDSCSTVGGLPASERGILLDSIVPRTTSPLQRLSVHIMNNYTKRVPELEVPNMCTYMSVQDKPQDAVLSGITLNVVLPQAHRNCF